MSNELEKMTGYIGTKFINAKPMTRQEYLDLRGWKLPEDENGKDAGYLVEYIDGGKPCHPDFSGYISWSPADVFNKSYSGNGKHSFGDALTAIKNGFKVARSGWNAANQWVTASNLTTGSIPAGNFWAKHNADFAEENGGFAEVPPCMTIKNAQGQIQMGWVPSQGDLFANDWVILV